MVSLVALHYNKSRAAVIQTCRACLQGLTYCLSDPLLEKFANPYLRENRQKSVPRTEPWSMVRVQKYRGIQQGRLLKGKLSKKVTKRQHCPRDKKKKKRGFKGEKVISCEKYY